MSISLGELRKKEPETMIDDSSLYSHSWAAPQEIPLVIVASRRSQKQENQPSPWHHPTSSETRRVAIVRKTRVLTNLQCIAFAFGRRFLRTESSSSSLGGEKGRAGEIDM